MEQLNQTYIIDKASNVWEDKKRFNRVGIIPYFLHEQDFYFLMMVDAFHQEITDAGGYPRRKEKWVKTASRELYEETRGIFMYTTDTIIDKGIIVYHKDLDIAIIFMPETGLNPEIAKELCIHYKLSYMMGINNKDRKEFMENSDMMMFSLKELTSLTGKGRKEIYRPVRFLLRFFFRHLIKDFFFFYLK